MSTTPSRFARGLPPNLVCETASFHGGDAAALTDLIDALKAWDYPGPRGVKFHPIAAASLALPEFHAYPIYERLQLPAQEWSRIIARAAPLDVWLEMADAHCVAVLAANRAGVRGVKFQASMVENAEVLERLPDLEPSGLDVMLNVSGLALEAIEACIERFAGAGLSRERIALQIGFQGYPTAVADTMLNKIAVLRHAFPAHALAFADHVAATDPFARVVPALAYALGCDAIEKHACLSRATAEFDHYSALEPDEMREVAGHLAKTARAHADRFVGTAERRYLDESVLQPALTAARGEGRLVGSGDVMVRRQGRAVLSQAAIRDEQARGRVLARDVPARSGLTRDDYRDANVAVVVACRMKSTRLPRKPFADLAGRSAVERCLENCLLAPRARSVVLATSTHPDDAELETVVDAMGGRVGFHRGDPDDVLRRYLDVADRDGIDVIVRVTADNPVVSPEIAGVLLDAHFRAGADLTRATNDAVGTGAHIINVEAMRRVDRLLGGAPMSEYMNWYFENNPEHFRIELVELPAALTRDYRLTLDYPADLALFERLFAELERRGRAARTPDVFAVLDEHPEIAALNTGQTIVYKSDEALIERLRRETRLPPPAPDA